MSIIDTYFDYVGTTESPNIYHRWVFISIIGALLERSVYLKFGHNLLYPNQYILLMGSPGARKGTAINIGKKLLTLAGYRYFAPDRAKKETIWYWMGTQHENTYDEDQDSIEDIETMTLDLSPAQLYLLRDEFTAFTGVGDEELFTSLTDLWDNLDDFNNPKLTGQNVFINKPTVNILSGTTPTNLSRAIPSSMIGGGFFSRVIFINGNVTDKVAWPSLPDKDKQINLVNRLREIRSLFGEIKLTDEARKFATEIYHSYPGIRDRRFQYYLQRRYIHLLKLAIILATMELELVITKDILKRANTYLFLAEVQMPQAIGHFGQSSDSAIANLILEAIKDAPDPLSIRDLYGLISADVKDLKTAATIIANLVQGGKVQKVKIGDSFRFLPKITIETSWANEFIDLSLVTEQERL